MPRKPASETSGEVGVPLSTVKTPDTRKPVRVLLSDAEYSGLLRLAAQELRTATDQAHWILRQWLSFEAAEAEMDAEAITIEHEHAHQHPGSMPPHHSDAALSMPGFDERGVMMDGTNFHE